MKLLHGPAVGGLQRNMLALGRGVNAQILLMSSSLPTAVCVYSRKYGYGAQPYSGSPTCQIPVRPFSQPNFSLTHCTFDYNLFDVYCQ